MIEEPYRWVEAIGNRREYIEHQLSSGSPIACLGYAGGILFFTLSRERQKIFEIYDRIAMGAIGHPGDIERLRMAAIEVTGTEGFTRSAQDVSLRRLANYSLSPALKTAFEQVYGAPYLARMIFAELGRGGAADLFVRLDYDGSIHTNGSPLSKSSENFGVISGTPQSTRMMEQFLRAQDFSGADLGRALNIAMDAWTVGHMTPDGDSQTDLPPPEKIAAHREEQLAASVIEAAILERGSSLPITYRPLTGEELASLHPAKN